MHVHILGICGTFMAGVAAIAREAGHRVTGSDRSVYPPMSDQLAALGIELVEGYGPEQLDPAPDVVVVGNVMSRGMGVVEALLNSRIPYQSGPEWLAHQILGSRRVVAVAGTHGKTTTTSLLAWMLESAGQDCGFLIGGVAQNFGISARLGSGEAFVIEADEYDTAFFDKRAKFLHYRPEIAVVNNLEFDHADIYADLAAIQWQFHQLLRALPGRGALLVRAGDTNIATVLRQGCWTPVETWSSDPAVQADWTGMADGDRFRLWQAGQLVGQTDWTLTGQHNAENVTAALLAARHLGVEPAVSLEALRTFRGVKRRLELRGRFGGVRLYDDFAHHPTAIARTLDGLRQRPRDGRLLVVFEPRSNTMRLGVHCDTLAAALSGADLCWVYQPSELVWSLRGTSSMHIRDSVDAIVADVVSEARPGDDLVVMSNGGFEGIHAKLEKALGQTG